MRNHCPVCHRAKCRWINLKPHPEKLSTEELERVVDHNVSYIEMIYSGNQGSAHAEERAYAALNPYCDEIEKRKTKQPVQGKTRSKKMKKSTAEIKVDKMQMRHAHLKEAVISWNKKPDLTHTQELMNAVRAFRRQLRKKAKKAAKTTKKAS